jgi:hypothetical protein
MTSARATSPPVLPRTKGDFSDVTNVPGAELLVGVEGV